MQTYRFKIKNKEELIELDRYPVEYSYMFRHIYSNLELSEDKGFIESALGKFVLMDKSIYDSCLSECLMKYSQWESSQNKIKEKISLYEKRIKHLLTLDTLTNHKKREMYKLIYRISRLKRRIGKQVVFGGLSRLREVTRFAQINDQEKYQVHLQEYRKKRIIGFYIKGRACEGGNRKFDFHFDKNQIIFKPEKSKKFNLEIKPFHNIKKPLLEKLQYLVDNDLIPISVHLYADEIQISVDNELMNGFSFNQNEFKKEIQGKEKEERKEIYIKWINEQKERKFKNKNINIIGAVDLNPKNIGFSIVEISPVSNKIIKILHKEAFCMEKLSESKQSINKIKYELSKIYQRIFNVMNHYKAAKFSMEDLNFKSIDAKSTEFNRLTKNIWCRNFQLNLISKYTQNLGIELVEVNPAYSSFIGNLIYSYFDPISASLEIARRGFIKYIKGSSLYPSLDEIPKEKMSYLFRESPIDIKVCNWKQLHKIASIRKLRVRNLTKIKSANFMHKYSNVYISL